MKRAPQGRSGRWKKIYNAPRHVWAIPGDVADTCLGGTSRARLDAVILKARPLVPKKPFALTNLALGAARATLRLLVYVALVLLPTLLAALRGLADVASWTVSGSSWRGSGAVGNGWVHHQSSVSSGSSSPPSAKVSTLAATDCPALGAASSAPPQLPSSMLRALWTAGRSDSDLRLSRSCLRIASEPLTHSTGHGMTITRIGDYGPSHSFTRYPGSVFETTSELASVPYSRPRASSRWA